VGSLVAHGPGVTCGVEEADGESAVHAAAASLLQSLAAHMKIRSMMPTLSACSSTPPAASAVKGPYSRTSVPAARPVQGGLSPMASLHVREAAPQ